MEINGEMDPKAFENLKKVLASDAHSEQTYHWTDATKSVIAADKNGTYPTISGDNPEFPYSHTYTAGARPEGYLSTEASPGEKSERDKAQALIDEYNKKVKDLIAAGGGNVKLESICDDKTNSTPATTPATPAASV